MYIVTPFPEHWSCIELWYGVSEGVFLASSSSSFPISTRRSLLRVGYLWSLSIRKEPILSGFLTLNAESILPHAGIK